MARLRTSRAIAAATIACALTQFHPAAAEVSAGYQGKTIKVIVGYPPGGGYDAYARLMAAHYAKFLPGEPAIVVQHMPGASSIRSANFIAAKAERDGTTVALFASSAAFAPVLENDAAQYKPNDFTWIGNFERATGTCSAWKPAGVATFQDVLERPVVFGASGPAGFDSEYPRAINALFATRIRVIHGYAGATSVMLAMQRGEVQGGCGFPLASLLSVRREDFKAGRLVPIIQFALKSDKLPGVPHVNDLARSDDDRKVFNLIFNRDVLGRPVAAPPGIAEPQRAALRKAFDAMVADDAFRKDAEKRFLVIEPQTGAEVEAFVSEMAGYAPEVVARAKKALVIGAVENVELKSVSGKVNSVGKGALEVSDEAGKVVRVKVQERGSSILVAGSKAEVAALKVGMACTVRYLGEDDLAKTIACD